MFLLGWIISESSRSLLKVQRMMFQGPTKMLQGRQILMIFYLKGGTTVLSIDYSYIGTFLLLKYAFFVFSVH